MLVKVSWDEGATFEKTDIEIDVRTFYIFTLKILHRNPEKFKEKIINLNPTSSVRFRFEENVLTSILFVKNGSVHKELKSPEELLLDLLSTPIERSSTIDQNLIDTTAHSTSVDFEGAITAFYATLLAKQQPLGKEFEQVLYDNLWNLYVRS